MRLIHLAAAGALALLAAFPLSAQPISDRTALPLRESVIGLMQKAMADGLANLPDLEDRPLIIDPLIDRATGQETTGTKLMSVQIREFLAEHHPRLQVRDFTPATIAERPIILLGAVTPVKGAGSMDNADGPTDAYRIWNVLVDTRDNNKIIAHPTSWVRADTMDPTPIPFNRDAPVWTPGVAMQAYLRTCAAPVGGNADPAYIESLRAEAFILEGMEYYAKEDYVRALNSFTQAYALPRGQQMRTYSGLFLTHNKLGNRIGASMAMDMVVAFGARQNVFFLKLLFEPGKSAWTNVDTRKYYEEWLRRLAVYLGPDRCLVVSGHTSPTGNATNNIRLSQRRAEYVAARLAGYKPELRKALTARGYGARQNLVGVGTDDETDALDRRVQFDAVPCT